MAQAVAAVATKAVASKAVQAVATSTVGQAVSGLASGIQGKALDPSSLTPFVDTPEAQKIAQQNLDRTVKGRANRLGQFIGSRSEDDRSRPNVAPLQIAQGQPTSGGPGSKRETPGFTTGEDGQLRLKTFQDFLGDQLNG